MKTENIDIVPDVTLFAKLGSANYTVSEAISELIDNSIDARVDKVRITINIGKDSVHIEDNGTGMNKQTAINSIVLGKSNKQAGDLGHFGMGLKTACMSLGKSFSIKTTPSGSNDQYIIDFDSEQWEKNNKWDQQLKITSDSTPEKSGTEITITKLRFNQHKNLVESLLEHLSERFGVFVQNKEAEIVVNGKKVTPQESKLVDNSRHDFVIELSTGQTISGWTGILIKGSQEKSGFNLYRYKRLIRAHEKLGYQYHPSKMWVTGEINLDPIPVTHNKREFISTDPLFVEFFEKFKEILKDVIDKSQNKNKEEKIKDLPKHIKETLKDNLMSALNSFDDLQEFAFPQESKLKRDPKGVELNKERREIAGSLSENDNNEPSKNTRNPKKVSENKAKFITVNGTKYKFDFDWANLDNEEVSKEAFLDSSTNTITVLLNTRYKLLDMIKPDILYMVFYISEGIIEVFLKESKQSTDKLVSLRDGIIKRLADIYAENIEIKIKEKDENEVEAYNHLIGSKEEDTVLSENEKTCLIMRLEEGRTLQEIGNHFGFTRERARQLIKRAVQKISQKSVPRESDFTGVKDEVTKGTKNSKEAINEIILSAAIAYNIPLKDVMGRGRQKDTIVARHIAMYNLRASLGLSFPAIGKIFDRDHTTIIHAFTKVESQLNSDI